MTVRERILAAMYWNEPDHTPLTAYEVLLPRGAAERRLREAGVGIIRRLPAHRVEHRHVEIVSTEYWDKGRRFVRRTLKTPVGEVWQTLEPDEVVYETNTWIHEHFIKGPQDYRVMEYVARDAVPRDNYASLREAQRRVGEDGLVYVRVAKSPIQEIIYQMTGLERFSYDAFDRPELVDSLHAVLSESYDRLYEIAAGSPVEILLLSDNLSADVLGRERFRKYLLPAHARLKSWMTGTDKRLASHMDGRLAALKEEIASSPVQIVEALTPPPMGDLSIAEARRAWPDKAIWINFTSSVIVDPPEAVRQHTRQLLREAGGKRGFAISITEDAPVQPLERTLEVIAEVLREET